MPPLPGSFGSLGYIQIVTNAESPPETAVLNGAIIGLRSSDVAWQEMGSGPDNPGSLFGVHGYPIAGGPTGQQFLATPQISAATRQQFEQIPGGTGWLVKAAHDKYANNGTALINTYNVPENLVLGALADFYNFGWKEKAERVRQGVDPNPL